MKEGGFVQKIKSPETMDKKNQFLKTVLIRTIEEFFLPPQVTIEQPNSKNLIFYDLPALKSAKTAAPLNEEEEKQRKQLLANYLRRPENVPVVLQQEWEQQELAAGVGAHDVIQDLAVNANYSDLAARPDWEENAIFLVGTRIFFCYLDSDIK